MQTLNSYARLIWVRHLHGISDNCQSPKIRVETRLCGHFRTAKISNTQAHAKPFIESIVRKVALIRCSPCLTSYAGVNPKKKYQRFLRMPSVRSAPQRITGLPGQPQPDDDVGLFIACLSDIAPLQREFSMRHASAFSTASMSCSTVASPFSPQYNVIICLSASTL